MVEASFTQKRRETELKTEALKVEQELAKAQARVRVLDKENKVDQSKAVISSGTETGKKVWLKEELYKNISSNNSKERHGIQNCNTFQEHFHYKEVTFKRIYPARSISDARNYTLINEIWIPDPTVISSQDIPAQNLLHQSRYKKMTTSSSAHGSENGYIADLFCTLVREQAAPQVTIEPFDGNPLNFSYFLSIFPESEEEKIEDPVGRLIRLIKCTTGDAQELGKHFINEKPEQGYRNAMELLRRLYGKAFGCI